MWNFHCALRNYLSKDPSHCYPISTLVIPHSPHSLVRSYVQRLPSLPSVTADRAAGAAVI